MSTSSILQLLSAELEGNQTVAAYWSAPVLAEFWPKILGDVRDLSQKS